MSKYIQFPIYILLVFIFAQCSDDDAMAPDETVTDADGNIYATIKMGNQVWMLENLKTTSFNDGTPITAYTFGENWNKETRTFPFYQWASTDDLNNAVDGDLASDYYGVMYNHAALSSGKLAPNGWRLPTEADWNELKNYIANNGHSGNEGNALKSASGWNSASGNGTDIYGFNGLPNGYIDAFGGPKADGLICTWATSTLDLPNEIRRIVNLYDSPKIEIVNQSILLGAGVRCIKE